MPVLLILTWMLSSRQQTLIGLTRILTALIGMMQQTRWGFAVLQGQLQRVEHQDTFQSRLHCPADDFARKQVHDGRQIQPSFGCGDVGDISQPL